jgi:Coenzyme PQQ synthesis protein D (PqqD)
LPHLLRVASGSLEWRRVDDEIVILNTKSSRYLSLNRAGAVLWPLVHEGADEAALTTALVGRYGLDPQRAADDVAAFVSELAAHGILEPEDSDSSHP